MFDLGLTELLFIVAIAVLVVPAKDLPGLMRSVGRGFGKLRRMARDFQRELGDAVRVDGLADVERRVFEIRWQTETDFAEDLSIVAGSKASEGPRDMEPNPVAQNAIDDRASLAVAEVPDERSVGAGGFEHFRYGSRDGPVIVSGGEVTISRWTSAASDATWNPKRGTAIREIPPP